MVQHEVRFKRLETPFECGRRLLTEPLATALHEGTGVIMIRGLPGVGVSRVLQGALAMARDSGATTTVCTLDSWERDVPYAALERLFHRVPVLRPLVARLTPDAPPLTVAREMVGVLQGEYVSDERPGGERRLPLVIAVDNLEWCDAHSSQTLRYLISRGERSGTVFVVGDHVTAASELGDFAARFAATEDTGSLFEIPDLDASVTNAVIIEETGSGVSSEIAGRVARLTGGRYEALIAYLNGVSRAELEDLAAVRILPTVTSARLHRHPPEVFTALPPTTRLGAELCALTGEGVPLARLQHIAGIVGVDVRSEELADGVVVVQHAVNGTLYLRDPLSAADIQNTMDEERRRALHRALADVTYGITSLLHRAKGEAMIDDAFATWAIEAADRIESQGRGADAVRLLDVASQRARGTECARRLLVAFGLACVRQQRHVEHQSRLGEFADETTADPVFGYIYAWLRSVKAHGRVEAQTLRRDYIAAPPTSLDHEFMQADIAYLDFLAAAQTGGDAMARAWQSANARLAALADRRPEHPELAYLDGRARLLQFESVAAAAMAAEMPPEEVVGLVRALEATASELPDDAAEAVTALTACLIALIDVHDLAWAERILTQIDRRMPHLARPSLMPGQLAIARVIVALRRGRWAQGRVLLDRGLDEVFEGLDMPARAAMLSVHAWMLAVDGEFDEAQRILGFAESFDQYRYSSLALDALVLARAELLRHTDGPAAALAVIERGLEQERFANSVMLQAMRIEVLAEIGESERAQDAHREFSAFVASRSAADTSEFDWLAGCVAEGLGDVDGALAHYERGVDAALSPLTHGKSLLGIARCRVNDRGARAQVREAIARARGTFEQIGAVACVSTAEALLTELEREWARLADELSTREEHVAVLAAAGWTNKEIARELGVSAATVAFHLTNVFAKLGIAKRSELPTALR